MNTSKKRKKPPTTNSSNDASKKKKVSKSSDDSRKFVKNKKSISKNYIKSQDNNAASIKKSNKYSKSNENIIVNTAKKYKKKKLKSKEHADFNLPIQPKNIQKAKKTKKLHVTNVQSFPSTSKESSTSPAVKGSKVKKVKKKLQKSTLNSEENINSVSDDELSDICISDDNESDEEVLRAEIQNSSIFKQIEKLMKKAPHLNPANAGLEAPDLNDGDNSSEVSFSIESCDEESDIESDVQDASSSESDFKDSGLKKESMNKKHISKGQDKNVLLANKNSDLSKNVTESSGFNRTLKGNALKRNMSDKGEMSSNLKNKVLEKLAGAKFRFLNEKLYTETGKEAFKYFQENIEEFDDYHSGYRLQVSKWPMNPVNEIIADIQKLKKSFVIADLGCGEAKIAQTFPKRTIHSFDLVPLNEFVKACDISKVPLPNESVDVAIFCLSLMGTNLKDYLCEAFRILKIGGILKIAEVESRIDDLGHFINYLKSIGFTLGRKNTKHKMFVFLDLKKENQKCKLGKVPSLSLRPCMYKKR